MKRTAIVRRTRVKKVNRKRKASEFARCYHSRERVRFVKALPCLICRTGPCDNAHIVTGGMGRKADYDKIVPLCCTDAPDGPGYPRGHHGVFHQLGRDGFVAAYASLSLDLDAAAVVTEAMWQAFSGEAAPPLTHQEQR